MERSLLLNSVTCLQCGTVLTSYSQHDFNMCECDNRTMVDGGLVYSRFGGVDLSKIGSNCVYDDAPFEVIRKAFYRGTYGKNGDEDLTYVKLCDINDGWLESLIKYEEELRPDNKYLKYYKNERSYRKKQLN